MVFSIVLDIVFRATANKGDAFMITFILLSWFISSFVIGVLLGKFLSKPTPVKCSCEFSKNAADQGMG